MKFFTWDTPKSEQLHMNFFTLDTPKREALHMKVNHFI